MFSSSIGKLYISASVILWTRIDGNLCLTSTAVSRNDESMRRCPTPVVSRREIYAAIDILIERKRTLCPSFVKARMLMKYSKFEGPSNPTTTSGSDDENLCGMRDLYC